MIVCREREASLTVWIALAPSRVCGADPLAIGEKTKEEIAWFRHAEIKHGRVAMAAFVGFLVQTVGLQFPGQLTKGMTFGDLAATGGPADQWDALPTGGKLQILLATKTHQISLLKCTCIDITTP